ncbi:MAG: LysM peptidoglycan-binding domain-containing protein [Anaerolineales bacterium]|nr:LysM peptidoglycan-binding domain-containing protein [Anaerolineales bacterium]
MQKWTTAVSAVLGALALGLAALFPASPGLALAQQNCASTYVVKTGDTLFTIALGFTPVTWQQIAQANNLADPNRILVGQSLCIPAATTPGAATPTVTRPAATPTPTRPTATPTGPTPTAAPPTATPVPFLVPVFTIKTVTRDATVSIAGQNFPPAAAFTARMGAFGTLAVNGPQVGTVKVNPDGTVTGTFNIPAEFKGASLIAIRLDGPGGWHSYNWFWNYTATMP